LEDLVNTYANELTSGNRRILSKAITLAESSLRDDQVFIQGLLSKIENTNKSYRIAITGIPGVGKSTFINALAEIISKQKKVAILSIDPSSALSGGSILGDKTRMDDIVNSPQVYIRPSSTNGHYGGINAHTFNTILLCEAAGYDIVLIETVGVGQSEIEVRHLCDFMLYLTIPSTGDELQGIKRGIMEQIDGIVINKTDAYSMEKINQKKLELIVSQGFMHHSFSKWKPKINMCSSHKKEHILPIWEMLSDFYKLATSTGYFVLNRNHQSHYIYQKALSMFWEKKMKQIEVFSNLNNKALEQTANGAHPFYTAEQVINKLI